MLVALLLYYYVYTYIYYHSSTTTNILQAFVTTLDEAPPSFTMLAIEELLLVISLAYNIYIYIYYVYIYIYTHIRCIIYSVVYSIVLLHDVGDRGATTMLRTTLN